MPSFDTPEPISVMIEFTRGNVHLIVSDRLDTVVVVNPSDRSRRLDVEAAEQTRVDYSAGSLLIKGPKARGLGSYIGAGGRIGSVDVTIELPLNSRLQGDATLADFRGDGRLGDVRIKTAAGNIRLDQAGDVHIATGAGSVTVDRASGRTEVTGSGSVRVGEIGGPAEIKNLNGKTWLGEVTGSVRVKAANGDITIERGLGDVAVKTANGNIQVGEVVSGSVDLETGSGALDVGIRAGTAAWVDASTRFGRVRNALDSAESPEQSQPTVEIRARTYYGDIVIHRA